MIGCKRAPASLAQFDATALNIHMIGLVHVSLSCSPTSALQVCSDCASVQCWLSTVDMARSEHTFAGSFSLSGLHDGFFVI